MAEARCRPLALRPTPLAMRRAWLIPVAVWAIAFAAAPARGDSVEPFAFDRLVAEADEIFIGTVQDITARRLPSDAIVTDVRFSNLTLLKGAAEDPLTLMVFGGTIGAETVVIAGLPRFEASATYVVFAKDNGRSMFPVVGANQGLFRVLPGPNGAPARISDAYGNVMTLATGEAQAEPLTLDTLIRLIRERLAPGR